MPVLLRSSMSSSAVSCSSCSRSTISTMMPHSNNSNSNSSNSNYAHIRTVRRVACSLKQSPSSSSSSSSTATATTSTTTRAAAMVTASRSSSIALPYPHHRPYHPLSCTTLPGGLRSSNTDRCTLRIRSKRRGLRAIGSWRRGGAGAGAEGGRGGQRMTTARGQRWWQQQWIRDRDRSLGGWSVNNLRIGTPLSSVLTAAAKSLGDKEMSAAESEPTTSLTQRPMNLVFVAAEVAPWSKTGGLGDVVGGLPIELARRGHKVMSIAPRYDQYRDGWDTTITVKVMGETVRYFHCHKKGVDRVFVDHPWFLAKVWGKTGSKLYGERSAADYVDNPRRFALFCRAAVEAVRVLPFGFGGDSIDMKSPSSLGSSSGANSGSSSKKSSSSNSNGVTFIANDWHSALVPVLLKHVYQPQGLFLGATCALCVHNIAFQGRFFEDKFETMDLPQSVKYLFEFQDGYPICFDETTIHQLQAANVSDPDKYMKEMMNNNTNNSSSSNSKSSSGGRNINTKSKADASNNNSKSRQMYKKINWLKAGFMSSDKNLTVSPNYALEIMSGAEKGVELDDVVRLSGGIEGIVNGMDPAEWSPDVDQFIDLQYDAESIDEGKLSCKMALQAELGLEVNESVPLIGFIGRLEEQKGVDIMLSALPTIINEANKKVRSSGGNGSGSGSAGVQIVVLGTGKKVFERMVRGMEDMSPHAKGIVQFSAPLAHQITAGADFMMVPSRFEPCGLIQLHAMRYGTVPIVSSTGGLVDTVKEGVTGYHIGSLDPDDLLPKDVESVASTVLRATREFQSKKFFEMRSKCINQDLTWKKPALKWEGMLEILQFGEDETSSGSNNGIEGKSGKEKKEEVTTPAQEL